LLWVITLGVCQFTMSSSVENPWSLQDYFHTYAYTLVYSSNLGFDEFFFIAAFLLTLKIKDYNQESAEGFRVKDFPLMFLKRFLRLAPVYYLVFLFGWQIGPRLSSGPCWFTYEKGFSNCEEYWWSVFTFTINFFPNNSIANEGCYYWGWYPACDLQIFLVAPLIILLILN
jgi:hypothetical protein